MAWIWVFLGGGLGSLSRYGISKFFAGTGPLFPWATFLANVLACVLLGFLVGMSLREELSSSSRLFLMTGFCGGFSTFSTFSSETWQLFQTGHYTYAMLNIAGSVLVCLAGIWIGLKLAG